MGEDDKHPASLKSRILGGMFWAAFAAVFVKAVTLAGQLLAPWYLEPSDFGRAAMAIAIANMLLFLAPGNFGPIVVRETRQFEALAGQVFWLSLLASLSGATILIAIALILAQSDRATVAALVVVLAMALPLQALPTIYAAKLSRELNIRASSVVNMGAGVITTVAMLALAITGGGPYALVVPLLIAAAYSAAAYRVAAGRMSIPAPQPSSWGGAVRAVFWVAAFSGTNALYAFAPQLVVGAQLGSGPAGLFYWAWLISNQLVMLIASSVQSVMFPALTRLQGDHARRRRVFELGYGFFLVVGGAVALLQAFAGEILVRHMFEARWHAASAIILAFSIAAMSQAAHAMVVSQLLAEGEFRRLALLTLGSAVLVLFAVAVPAGLGASVESVAACASLSWALTHVLAGVWVAARLEVPLRAHLSTLWRVYSSAIVAYVAADAAFSVPSEVWASLARAGSALLVFGVLVWCLMRAEISQWRRAARLSADHMRSGARIHR